ncbi:MAG: recombinase family protein [Ruminococcus sp.]|nr:recombinase family protein [Ruminococcus sp.]
MSNQDKITALYCRLSKDDLNVGDSDSIVHQRAILEKYAEDNCFPNIRVFVDDGYSGVSFDRPGFQEMYKLIEAGKVGIVITKDLSRLGRNYIEVGNYTEFIFPRYGVRYIAISDNYDSLFSDNNELAPFKNLFNEWYARDTSKKIRAVFKAKAERGERLGTTIPYGYRRDPNSGKECRLLINEETAPVVKMIFAMCAEGIGPSNISKALEERKILKPTMYRFMREGKYGTHTDTENPYKWNERTIADILDNEIYLGHTINCRTRIASFKDKRTIKVPKEEQLRFENTHEAIIDQETWDIVRKVREGRIRKTRMGEINKYSGLIYCADCGKKHYFVRGKTVKRENYNFICGNYRKHVGEEKCTPHSIREVVLDEIVLEEINKALYYARNNTKEFTDYISKKTSSQYRKELNSKTAELSKAEKRIVELKSLFKRLYEDNVLGRISDEQYRMLSADYNDEQKELEASIPKLQKEIDTLKNECTNVQKLLDIVRKYVCVQELTPEVLRTFISKIVVHEREKKHSQTSPQQIDIYFRYIGTFALPSTTDKAEGNKYDERRTA